MNVGVIILVILAVLFAALGQLVAPGWYFAAIFCLLCAGVWMGGREKQKAPTLNALAANVQRHQAICARLCSMAKDDPDRPLLEAQRDILDQFIDQGFERRK